MDATLFTQALYGSLRAVEAPPTVASVASTFALVAFLPLLGVIPMTLVCLAAAARLPPAAAVCVILAGTALNTAVAWTLARGAFGARIENWLKRRGGRLGAVREGAQREPLKWAFLARYVPAPFIAAPMVLSSAGVGLGKTLLGTLLGMVPWAAVYVYAVHAGRQDSITGFSRAAAVLVLSYTLLRLLRKRLSGASSEGQPLKPRVEGRPVVRLYTLPGQDLSEEARHDLAALRDALGFEVDETILGPVPDGAEASYRDHAPVALLGGERLFNYKMDENVLRERLKRPLAADKERA